MDLLGQIEWWVGRLGGVAIAVTLGVIFTGIFRGIKRFRGTNAPQPLTILLKPFFYILAGAGFFILCWWIWLPLAANHPFIGGNGCTARLVMNPVLMRAGSRPP